MNPFNTKEQTILLRALEALPRTTGITGHVIERELVIAEDAYLRGRGLFALVKGQRANEGEGLQPAPQERTRAGTATNLRVFFALLCKPELLNAPYPILFG